MRPLFAAVLPALLLPGLPAQDRSGPSPLRKKIEALAAHIRKTAKHPDQAAALAEKAARQEDPHGADLALALAFPDYGKALALLEKGDPAAPAALARLAEESKDPYVRLHALYHLGRTLLEGDDPEGAAAAFSRFFAGKSRISPLEAEASFFYGIALSRVPSPEEAAHVLSAFLRGFPRAPERYRAVAFQVLKELQGRQADPIGAVADLMESVERRLRKGDPGETTVQREKEILDKLDELLKKLQRKKKENKGQGGSSNSNAPPKRPAPNSRPHGSPKGTAPLHRGARVLAERWGRLSPKEREKVLQELRKRFPPRYRALLEAYFRRLGKKR